MIKRSLSMVPLLMLAACGGGSGGNGGVTTPTPTSTPTPTPTPTPSYPLFADLTGSQTFRSACGSLLFNGNSPGPHPATGFGSGLDLAFNAGAETYTITGDGQSLAFGPADRDPSAPAGATSYARATDGFPLRFSLGRPAIGGIPLDYTRGFSLRAPRFGQPLQYQCLYGVPTLATDLPAASVVYARGAFIGTVYATTSGNVQQVYSTEASEVTATLDPATSRFSFTLRLRGTLQSAGGPATTQIELGSYTAAGTIDPRPSTSYYGTLSASDRLVIGTFGGWLFGPQGREAGLALTLTSTDPANGTRVVVLGNLLATR